MQLKLGHFEPDGGLVYIPTGFKPDLLLYVELGVTNPLFMWWWGMMENDEASNSKEGILDTAGTKTKLADNDGFAAYDTGSAGPTIVDWSGTLAVVARTNTAHGTYVRPTSAGTDIDGRVADRNAIFEATAGTTTGSTQPSWPVETGGVSASDNGVTWERVNVSTLRVGYQGFRVAAVRMTNGQEAYYAAFQADGQKDHGDVVGWAGGIEGA